MRLPPAAGRRRAARVARAGARALAAYISSKSGAKPCSGQNGARRPEGVRAGGDGFPQSPLPGRSLHLQLNSSCPDGRCTQRARDPQPFQAPNKGAWGARGLGGEMSIGATSRRGEERILAAAGRRGRGQARGGGSSDLEDLWVAMEEGARGGGRGAGRLGYGRRSRRRRAGGPARRSGPFGACKRCWEVVPAATGEGRCRG